MTTRFLAQDPSKRWAEVLFLAYTPIWMAVIAMVQVTHAISSWGDGGYLALGVALALPPWLLPLLLPAPAERRLPLFARYSTKAIVFITVLSFVQNYFGTLFFFQALGMEYHFPVRLKLNGTPLFLYLVTVAYFATYFAFMQIACRACKSRFPGAPLWLKALVVVLLSYAVAFGETFFMANDMLRPYFSYADKSFVLRYGSFCYGTVFFVSLPLFYRIDEDPGPPRPLSQVVWEVLGANLLILLCYEVYLGILPRLHAS